MDNKEIEFYKVVRNSIEHFDRLLANFRQIIFTFNGLLITANIALFNRQSNIAYVKIFFIGSLLVVVNILVWFLEKHYHRYLLTVADVAKHIENEIFADDVKKHLTARLEETKYATITPLNCSDIVIKFIYDKFHRFKISTCDFLYLLPISGVGVLNAYLINVAVFNKSIDKGYNWFGWFSIALVFIYIVCVYVIIRFNILFENSLKNTK